MSEEQEQLLVRHFRQVAVMLDGDEAGRKAAREIASRLVQRLVGTSRRGARRQPVGSTLVGASAGVATRALIGTPLCRRGRY